MEQTESVSALDVDRLRSDLARGGLRLVAIDGRGGAGKSTLARQLADGWPHAVIIEMDDFYRPSAERVENPEVHGGNYDHRRLVREVLEPRAAGRAGRYQRYDWREDRLAESHDVPADAVVLVEGVYSSSKLLREYFEFTIWVDCPYHVRLARGIGRDGGSMRAMWADHWMPLEDRYVGDEHPDARADLVIDGASAGADRVVFSLAPPRPRGLAFPVGLEDGEIRLEPWSEKDLPALQEASTDESITRITAVPSPYSPQAGDAFLRDRREAARHGSALSLAIQENKTAATLGGVNLNSFDWQRRCARVGYWVLPSARGRGAATGALRLISDWALSDLGLRRLEMHIEPSNVASIKVAEGAGYRVAGTVREKPFGKGLELDMLRYARARASRLFM